MDAGRRRGGQAAWIVALLVLLPIKARAEDALSKAQTMLEAGRAAEARDAMAEEIKQNPENVAAYRTLSLALEQLQRWEEAESAWILYAQITRSRVNRMAAGEHLAWCRAKRTGGAGAARTADEGLTAVEETQSTVKSAHFVVKTRNAKLTQAVSNRAEEILTSLCRTFLGDRAWANEIPITIHKDHADYVAAGNPAWSGGGTAFAFEAKSALDWKIKRSIDLFQLGADGKLDAELIPRTLPHELTHLVLSEHFGENPIPLWLTEGLAQNMEAVDLGYYDRVVAGDQNSGKKLYVPLAAVLTLDKYPEAFGNKYLFYRESASFTHFLLENMPRERFFKFLEDCKRRFSATAGLAEIFAVPHEKVGELLEKKWLEEVMKKCGSVKTVEEAEKTR